MNKATHIMLESAEGNKYFTYKKNLQLILNYSKKLNIKVFYVMSKDAVALDIDKLVENICNQLYKNQDCSFKIISKNLTETPVKRSLSISKNGIKKSNQ